MHIVVSILGALGVLILALWRLQQAAMIARDVADAAGGTGSALGQHSATLAHGQPGVLHGAITVLLYDDDGQIQETHSVSAGLDYPGVGPEHSFWKDSNRVQYTECQDESALNAFDTVAKHEGILPALESSHAIALLTALAVGAGIEIVVQDHRVEVDAALYLPAAARIPLVRETLVGGRTDGRENRAVRQRDCGRVRDPSMSFSAPSATQNEQRRRSQVGTQSRR